MDQSSQRKYWDIEEENWNMLPFELKVMIVKWWIAQWVAEGRDKQRPLRKKTLEALMSFGRCTCCKEVDQCESGHHPRKVLINWRYKVRFSFVTLFVERE